MYPNDAEAGIRPSSSTAQATSYVQVADGRRRARVRTTLFCEDYDERLAAIAGARGSSPRPSETYDNRGPEGRSSADPDGNEIGFGGAPG